MTDVPSGASSSSAPDATPAMLSGTVARLMLQGLQTTAGTQYERLLQAAGLDRYLQARPSDDAWPALPRADLQRLTRTVYEMLGEDLTRLFYRNLGAAEADLFLRSPLAQQGRARMAQLPAEQQFDWLVRRLLAVAAQGWNAAAPGGPVQPWYTVREDATAWYLAALGCAACAGVQGAAAPICSWVPSLLSCVAKGYGRRLLVREVTCAAMGAPQCVFAVEKPT